MTLLFIFCPIQTSSGKELAYPFIQLPSRREIPDYYEVIERPMDLNRIKKKIKDGRYSSLKEISDDIDLLCRNAQTYNTDESEIYQDSILLDAVWKRLVETVSSAPPPTSTSSGQVSNQPTTSAILPEQEASDVSPKAEEAEEEAEE